MNLAVAQIIDIIRDLVVNADRARQVNQPLSDYASQWERQAAVGLKSLSDDDVKAALDAENPGLMKNRLQQELDRRSDLVT